MTCSIADLCFSRLTAPLDVQRAWEVESLLLEIFEYGDYSLRAALRGDYAQTLQCAYTLAHRGTLLVGAAGCLQSRTNRAVALLGPVGVCPAQRGQGIGTALVRALCDYLQAEGCHAVYLGVAPGHPAARLYARLGFQTQSGIVLRRSGSVSADFDTQYWHPEVPLKVRAVQWGDFPGVQALLAAPSSMYTYDLGRHLFSTKYVPLERFLGVFPEMMKGMARPGGVAQVLLAGPAEKVVGIAQARRLPGPARHVAELDFFVHDNFLDQAPLLVRETILRVKTLRVDRIRCGCLSGDPWKRAILDQLGGRPAAMLARSVCLAGEFMDTVIYELE